jgi:ribonuclease P protein component
MFDSGRRHHHRLLSLIELTRPQSYLEKGKVAFFTPKKVGKAHDRNRVRRQMKEVYRRRLQGLQPSQLWIWLAKPAATHSTFEDLHSAMERLAQKASASPSPTSNP